ncbi:hypothetical protein V5735_24360 (plasmid) [Haladaptatus sp. SPP-AMP-3]|uniref:hypothetical protein n=1 Tax=Haladaptatus sp. SPP-AMP-3 TaxID=3121295 RepID=UPI003C2B3BDE
MSTQPPDERDSISQQERKDEDFRGEYTLADGGDYPIERLRNAYVPALDDSIRPNADEQQQQQQQHRPAHETAILETIPGRS